MEQKGLMNQYYVSQTIRLDLLTFSQFYCQTVHIELPYYFTIYIMRQEENLQAPRLRLTIYIGALSSI